MDNANQPMVPAPATKLSSADRRELRAAKAWFAAGEEKDALKTVSALAARRPSFDSFFVLAKLQLAAGDAARAVRSVKSALQLESRDKGARFLRTARRKLGRLPKEDRAILKQAKQMSAAGDQLEGIELVQRLIDRRPANFDAWYVMAKLQYAAGDVSDAESAVRRAVEIRADPKAKRLAKEIRRGGSTNARR